MTGDTVPPIKAIRAKCLDCTCGNSAEVRRCTVEKCPLYPYRMGHRPKVSNDTATDRDPENTQATQGIFTGEGGLEDNNN